VIPFTDGTGPGGHYAVITMSATGPMAPAASRGEQTGTTAMHNLMRFAIGVLRVFGFRRAHRAEVIVAMPPRRR